jgi:copper(I)-binding protein
VILSRRSALPPYRRGAVLAAVAAAALVPAIAGCEAGLNAPTQQWHQPTPGATAQASTGLRVSNMFVLGAPPTTSLPAGASAGVFFALAGAGSPDRLIGISAPGTATTVRLPSGGIRVGAQQSVLLTGPVPRVVLENLTRSLNGGQNIRMVLDFQNAGRVPLAVPVMPKASYFSTFSPAPASPSPTSTPTTGKRRHRQAGATPTPTASPTPS